MEFGWFELFEFRVRGVPKAQPRPRAFAMKSKGGKASARVYNPDTAKEWKYDVTRAVELYLPSTPFLEPLRIDIDFYMPRPKTFGAMVRKAYGGKTQDIPKGPVLHISKPDRDNLDKAVLDALGDAGLMRDDSQVTQGTIRKFYHGVDGEPGARIRVWAWLPVGDR